MKPSTTPARRPVQIVESSTFTASVGGLLSATEQRALQLLLADDPVRGAPVAGFPGLLCLDFAGCSIFYALAPSFEKVYLLDIEKNSDGAPPPSREDAALLRKALALLGKAAVIAGVKRGLKWLWEYFRDGVS